MRLRSAPDPSRHQRQAHRRTAMTDKTREALEREQLITDLDAYLACHGGDLAIIERARAALAAPSAEPVAKDLVPGVMACAKCKLTFTVVEAPVAAPEGAPQCLTTKSSLHS